MSQNHSPRSSSYSTACPTTDTRGSSSVLTSSSSASPEATPVARGKCSADGPAGVGGAAQIGSRPQRETKLSIDSGGSWCQSGHSTTPSSSPTPDENHGRSRYTRSPLPRRRLTCTCGSPRAPPRSQPNVGTTYSTRGAAGRALLGTCTSISAPERLTLSGVSASAGEKYSRKREVATPR